MNPEITVHIPNNFSYLVSDYLIVPYSLIKSTLLSNFYYKHTLSHPPPTSQSNMLGKENESAVADKKREAIKGKENDFIKEEKESMLCSYDDLFYGVLPSDNNFYTKTSND